MPFENLHNQENTIQGSNIITTEKKYDNQVYDSILKKISTQLPILKNLIMEFERRRKHIGTRRDNEILRNDLDELVFKIGNFENDVKMLICSFCRALEKKQNNTYTAIDKNDVLKEKLCEELTKIHNIFVDSMDKYHDKTKIILSKTNQKSINDDYEKKEQVVQTFENKIRPEIKLNSDQVYIKKRSEEIKKICDDVEKINIVLKEVENLVKIQDAKINVFEGNFHNIRDDLKNANNKLEKTYRQKKNKKKNSLFFIILMLFLFAFALIMIR